MKRIKTNNQHSIFSLFQVFFLAFSVSAYPPATPPQNRPLISAFKTSAWSAGSPRLVALFWLTGGRETVETPPKIMKDDRSEQAIISTLSAVHTRRGRSNWGCSGAGSSKMLRSQWLSDKMLEKCYLEGCALLASQGSPSLVQIHKHIQPK